MKNILIGILLGLSLTFGGCAKDFMVHSPEEIAQMSPVKKAQASLDQLKAEVIAVNRGAVADRKVGVYNDAEWLELKAKMNQLKGKIDNAQEMINMGDLVSASEKQELAQKALDFIKAELIKQKGTE